MWVGQKWCSVSVSSVLHLRTRRERKVFVSQTSLASPRTVAHVRRPPSGSVSSSPSVTCHSMLRHERGRKGFNAMRLHAGSPERPAPRIPSQLSCVSSQAIRITRSGEDRWCTHTSHSLFDCVCSMTSHSSASPHPSLAPHSIQSSARPVPPRSTAIQHRASVHRDKKAYAQLR